MHGVTTGKSPCMAHLAKVWALYLVSASWAGLSLRDPLRCGGTAQNPRRGIAPDSSSQPGAAQSAAALRKRGAPRSESHRRCHRPFMVND